jgi:hypothetical protein
MRRLLIVLSFVASAHPAFALDHGARIDAARQMFQKLYPGASAADHHQRASQLVQEYYRGQVPFATKLEKERLRHVRALQMKHHYKGGGRHFFVDSRGAVEQYGAANGPGSQTINGGRGN